LAWLVFDVALDWLAGCRVTGGVWQRGSRRRRLGRRAGCTAGWSQWRRGRAGGGRPRWTPGVDQFGGVGVAQLVDVDGHPGGGAVAGPPVVGGVVGQWPAGSVDAGPKQRPGGVAGPGQVELEQGNVAAVV